jgi:lipoprotein-releasing system permease protein
VFAVLVARRYLGSNPWQTALLIAGVALGVTAFVFITALIQGLAVRLTDDVTARSAHVSLEPADRVARILPSPNHDTEAVALVSMLQRKQIRTWSETVALLESQAQVTAISPQITGSAVLVRGEAAAPVAVTAVEPKRLDAISPVSRQIVAGDASLSANGILIGVRLAETMGLSVGQPVLFRTDRDITRLLIIEGIFKSGIQSLDERAAYLSLETARPLFLLPAGVTNIEIKLKDTGEARPFAEFLGGATGLRATPWQDRNASLADALTAQAQTGTLIQVFSLISVLIGIASALTLSANRRRSEVGIMRAFGISRFFIASVFILQGLLIGVVGASLGCLAGYGLCSWLASFVKPDGTLALPIAPAEGGYAVVFSLTTVGAVLASVIPARSAARLDALEAIQQ